MPYLPEPRRLADILCLPFAQCHEWLKALVVELHSVIKQGTFGEDQVKPGDKIVPAMDVYRTKLDKNGLVDKLKGCLVFRGDLQGPSADLGLQDTWNPHADFLLLCIFLAMCARHGIMPCQIDFVSAFLQAHMRERLFVELPKYWAPHLPEDLKGYCGRPLLLLKALYGYRLSGKFLWEDQAEFFESQGFVPCSAGPALWYRRLDDGGLLLLLQYSDDMLFASTCAKSKAAFLMDLRARFDCLVQPTADWYLQAHIHQDSNKNVTLDQV